MLFWSWKACEHTSQRERENTAGTTSPQRALQKKSTAVSSSEKERALLRPMWLLVSHPINCPCLSGISYAVGQGCLGCGASKKESCIYVRHTSNIAPPPQPPILTIGQ
jgi:hypothetical protein